MRLLFLLLLLATSEVHACDLWGHEDFAQELRSHSFEISQLMRRSHVQCKNLKAGESRILSMPSNESPTAYPTAYRLTQLKDKTFQSEVKLNILPGKGVSKQDATNFKEFIKHCLKSAKPYLTGPNGESFSVAISEDSKVPVSQVYLFKQVPRVDSQDFDFDMTCPVVVHELMHLHGLVDEYLETKTEAVKTPLGMFPIEGEASGPETTMAYNCRSLGPKKSLMSDQYQSYVEKTSTRTKTKKVCVQMIYANAGAAQEFCPKGWKSVKRTDVDYDPSADLNFGAVTQLFHELWFS
jgi:hypothetical protein